MRICGLDFTSSSTSGRKANHLVAGVLKDRRLELSHVQTLGGPRTLGEVLAAEGDWVLGLDFPFGLPTEFVAAQGWGQSWHEYGVQATDEDYAAFRRRIEAFRAARPEGRKQPKRHVDDLAGSQSPLTTVRTPVAAMFHAGAPALLAAACDVVPFRRTGVARTVVEAYPALIARRLVAGNRYKDGHEAQTREVRDTILRRIIRGDLADAYGFDMVLSDDVRERSLLDPCGDVLDSVLCAIQAAWAWTERDRAWGVPARVDAEGWIVDPALVRRSGASWTPMGVGDPLPVPLRGAFNSSRTRVRPLFRALLARDPRGRSWLPALLRLTGSDCGLRLAAAACEIEPACVRSHLIADSDGVQEELEGCFERAFPPPLALLDWCIEHPDRLIKPRGDRAPNGLGRSYRRDLLSADPDARAIAQEVARALRCQASDAAVPSKRAWWAFEGFTSVDCALETERLLLLIEGKRFEPLSADGSWICGRNQISRNLEVAAVYARAAGKDFAVLLIGPEGTKPPDETTLREGWPHLEPADQDALLPHYLGAIGWQTACAALAIDHESLPLTVGDIESVPVTI